jgi:hypothetical protein
MFSGRAFACCLTYTQFYLDLQVSRKRPLAELGPCVAAEGVVAAPANFTGVEASAGLDGQMEGWFQEGLGLLPLGLVMGAWGGGGEENGDSLGRPQFGRAARTVSVASQIWEGSTNTYWGVLFGGQQGQCFLGRPQLGAQHEEFLQCP